MSNCDDLNDTATIPQNSCVCCYPPDFSNFKINMNSKRSKFLLEDKIKKRSDYYVQELNIQRRLKILSDENLYINHIDPTTKPISTKQYKICSTCASRPDLETRIRDIFYIPLMLSETANDNYCVCCYPPDFRFHKIYIEPIVIDEMFQHRIKLINTHKVKELQLGRQLKILSDDNLYIYYVDPATNPLLYKKYKICSTCASHPDLEPKLRSIFFVPLVISEMVEERNIVIKKR